MQGRVVFYAVGIAAVVIACLVVLVLLPSGDASNRHLGQGVNPSLEQQLAVPAYVDPVTDPGTWTELTGAKAGTVGIIVANVNSGPGPQPVPAWASAIRQAHANGSRVLGYVDTGYLGSATSGHPGGLLTRSGSGGLQAWLGQIESDINAWYQFYGSDIGGIFMHRGMSDCGPGPFSAAFADQYRTLTAFVQQSHPGAITALNPGTAVGACFKNSADVLVTFEGSYADYTGSPRSSTEAFQPLTWSPHDPDKIWHIIYGVTSQYQLMRALSLSKARSAGYVYVTSAVPPDPFDTLPAPPYWSDELHAISASVNQAAP
jgi:hypothetical protein